MKSRIHTTLHGSLLLLFAVIVWYLFVVALDMPTLGVHENTLSTLYATAALLLLAAGFYLLHRPCLRISMTDLLAAALFAGVTISRFFLPGLAAVVKYDELLQMSMLYISLRIIFTTERRTMDLLLILLCGFGIYEAWIGICQVYGLAYSNHGLFKITGTLFNPGSYAGFIAPVFVCAVACVVRRHALAVRIFRPWSLSRMLYPKAVIFGIAPYLLGWGAAVTTAIVLPASMSRAALVAVFVGLMILLIQKLGVVTWLCRIYVAKPIQTSLMGSVVLVLFFSTAVGAYWVKKPSADGRFLMWEMDTRIMLNHPVCGVGLGNFAGAFGAEQSSYFASGERPEGEMRVAGSPESGFNEYLQFGVETGFGGFILLLLMTGTAIISHIRRGNPFGYGLLTAAVFACFSYPGSVLPLRLLFVMLLAGACSGQTVRRGKGRYVGIIMLLMGCMACWPGIYGRYASRVEAHRQWADMRMWMHSERYDYLIEDGKRLRDILKEDFRFLYDYGYALHKTGDYLQSNEVLLLGMEISSDPMFWNITGKNYEALGNFPAAEKAYLHAHNMIPDRIYPLYLLTKLYRTTGHLEKASVTARKVVEHQPKIESVQSREMQQELRDLIHRVDSPKK